MLPISNSKEFAAAFMFVLISGIKIVGGQLVEFEIDRKVPKFRKFDEFYFRLRHRRLIKWVLGKFFWMEHSSNAKNFFTRSSCFNIIHCVLSTRLINRSLKTLQCVEMTQPKTLNWVLFNAWKWDIKFIEWYYWTKLTPLIPLIPL